MMSIDAPAVGERNWGGKLNAALAALMAAAGAAVDPRKADYTGRRLSPGAGTDMRAAIQAALDAASDLSDSSWYAYLTRRSKAVRLPAGPFYISAPPDGSPSLVVPPGVHFDTSAAQLFFDYPATPSTAWAGILVKNMGSLRVGYLAPSSKNAPPDSSHLYDGVRLLGNDNAGTYISGYADSEIRGFDGASIRGIGSWITYISGIKLTSAYGYIASAWPSSNAFGYAQPGDLPGRPARGHNDLYLTDCYFNENYRGGFIGTVLGTAADVNGMDYTSGALQAYFTRCVFEQFDATAIHVTGYCVSLNDCGFEEVGGGNGMCWLDAVRSVEVNNPRVNYTGVPVVTAGGGTNTPTNTSIFKLTNVVAFDMSGGYVHNTYLNTMKLADAAASAYRIGPIVADAFDLAAGPMVSGQKRTHEAATWNAGHPVLGGRHQWVDSAGVWRSKQGVPSSETDGAPLGDYSVKATRTTEILTPVPNATFTVVDFTGTDAWDSNGYHDPATNPSRITPPAGRNELRARFPFASNTTGRRIIRIRKNGATTVESADFAPVTGGPTSVYVTVEDVAAAGDYYEVLVYQDSGGTLTSDIASRACWFSSRLVA